MDGIGSLPISSDFFSLLINPGNGRGRGQDSCGGMCGRDKWTWTGGLRWGDVWKRGQGPAGSTHFGVRPLPHDT